MNSVLAHEQSLLLEALAGRTGSAFNLRGLQVYRTNAALLAERTLASTYPVVAQLIGQESFQPLARHYWRQRPPQRGDLGQWGAELPEFLEAEPQLANVVFVGDVARLEWALHHAASAADAVLDAASFAQLAHNDRDDAADDAQTSGLVLSPGVFIMASAYPVVSLVNAHLLGQPSIHAAATMLAEGQGEYALVWRQGFKPRVRQLSAAEYHLLGVLVKKESLQAALDLALATDSRFDFNTWLSQAVQNGLVTGACRLDS